MSFAQNRTAQAAQFDRSRRQAATPAPRSAASRGAPSALADDDRPIGPLRCDATSSPRVRSAADCPTGGQCLQDSCHINARRLDHRRPYSPAHVVVGGFARKRNLTHMTAPSTPLPSCIPCRVCGTRFADLAESKWHVESTSNVFRCRSFRLALTPVNSSRAKPLSMRLPQMWAAVQAPP